MAHAQPVVSPPLYLDTHIVETLTQGWKEAPQAQLSLMHHLTASTNVIPLEWGGRHPLPEKQFTAAHAYYRMAWYTQVSVRLGRRSLVYTRGVMQNYTGSPGAAQLYLDSMGKGASFLREYRVDAYMNNSEVTSWTLEQSILLQTSEGEGAMAFGVSLLDTHRVQQGHLSGKMRHWQFQGDLCLNTTRGLPQGRTRGRGIAIHTAIVLPLPQGGRIGLWAENVLSVIWQQRLQQIRARVLTNTVIPDADGFLRAAPLLSGTVQEAERRLSLQPRYTLGAFLPRGASGFAVLIHRDTDWKYWVVYVRGGIRLAWLWPQGVYACEWRTGPWQWQIGMSHLQIDRVHHVRLTVRWTSPLRE
ncbi:MAG: hypothetical protein NZ520_02960 [bacterium]|nr:hypothetical protein [bacterium]